MKWVRRGSVAVVALLLGLVVIVYGAATSSLPRTTGTLSLPGLHGAVEVARDDFGVPIITAADQHDAAFALGFVHAQDRLFQMDFLRRLGSGRLAEAVGSAALPSDRFMRTLGLRHAAAASLNAVDDETRAALDAYAAGVNAFLDTREGFLPPEFLVLGLEPEPWTPADSLLWQRLMAMRLSGNWYEEALRATLLTALPPETVAELWAGPDPDDPTTISTAAHSKHVFTALMEAWPEALRPTLASNAWLLDGSRTASGAPLLANDPHLGLGVPNVWYLAEVRTPQGRVSGATVPGVPFHIVGHNGTIAWGLTTTHSDTMDLFVEDSAGPGLYLTPDGPQPFETRTETILVRDAPAEQFTVRATRHGPVVSDLLDVPLPEGSVLALAATALEPDDRTAEAILHLNRASSWQAAERALATYHAPQQNFIIADRAGTIAYLAPGRVPVRRTGRGVVPRPGAEGAFDWTGWLPYSALPRLENPPSGVIINANNRPVPEDYPHLLSVHWPAPHRAERIKEVLASLPAATPDDMRRLQLDALSPVFRDLWPLMEGTQPDSPAAADALAALRAWDGTMAVARPEPLVFTAWRLTLERAVFADDLGPLYRHWEGSHPRVLRRVLSGKTVHPWCDDVATPQTETCAEQLSASLDETLKSLETEFGAPSTWRWGAAHAVRLEHPVFRHLPVLGWLSALSAHLDGSDETVNRGGFSARGVGSWRQRLGRNHGAGLRAVYDLSDLDSSGYIIAAGQSGHLLSPHYRDMMAPWQEGRLIAIRPAPDSRVLTLEPKSTR
ncbi:MAG: penicillin acylase family protein [Rhodospirillaceae bacterium]